MKSYFYKGFFAKYAGVSSMLSKVRRKGNSFGTKMKARIGWGLIGTGALAAGVNHIMKDPDGQMVRRAPDQG